jgi:hypothetical protein
MDYFDIVNSSLLYILVSVVIVFVFFLAFYFAKKAWTRALELGYEKADLLKVIKSTIYATIVPSFAIVIGLFALAPILGNAWPWLRLSVIGSVTYELMAAETATGALLGTAGSLETASTQDLVTVMFVMTAGISSGLFTLLFFGKWIQRTVTKMGINKQSFSFVVLECFMIGLVATFLPAFLTDSAVAVLVFFTSMIITVSFALMVTKFKKISWLKDFILAFALLGGMASSVLWTSMLG